MKRKKETELAEHRKCAASNTKKLLLLTVSKNGGKEHKKERHLLLLSLLECITDEMFTLAKSRPIEKAARRQGEI